MFNEPPNTPEPESDSVLGWPQDTQNADTQNAAPVIPPQGAPPHSTIYDYHNRFGSSGAGNIEIPPHWAVPWSDLMMVMMVMFAVMYITKMAERDVGELFKKEAQVLPHPEPKPEPKPQTGTPKITMANKGQISVDDILKLSEKLVTQANLEDIDVVLTENQAVKVSVRGNLLFDLGKADLKPEAISFLDKLSQIIAANNYQIEIVGHTDNFPISNPAFPTNWELSAARAARVARYLIQAGNLEPGRFTVIGHAFYRPILPNTTPGNKAKNRRVEIIITRNEYKP
jgi:chemotaxis protein MotB